MRRSSVLLLFLCLFRSFCPQLCLLCPDRRRERVMEEIMPTIAKISRITANTVMTVILASMQYQARISAVSTSR